MTRDDLTAIWRECVGAGAEFVGPVAPPPVQLELPWEIAA